MRGRKYESSLSPTNVSEKLKGFLKVCDISKVLGSRLDPTPLSPKRVESPVTPELGRGKRSKFQTPCKAGGCSSSSTSHGESNS